MGLWIDFLLGIFVVVEWVVDIVIDWDYCKKKDGMMVFDYVFVWVDFEGQDVQKYEC